MVGRKSDNRAVAAAPPALTQGQSFSEAIDKLKSTDPPLFLSPNSDLSGFARLASQHLFASLKPYSPKSPFDQLHSDGFDVEQIWQQIDLQSQPLINTLKREIKRYEEKPEQILKLFGVSGANGVLEKDIMDNVDLDSEEDSEESEGLSDEGEDESEEDEEDEKEDDDDDDEEEDIEDDGDGVPEVEDEFLKIKDLEKYLVREEEKEYGSEKKESKKNKKKAKRGKNVDDEEDQSEESEEDDADELLMYGGDGGSEDGSEDNIRYEDFYVPDKKRPVKKQKQVDKSDDSEMEEENADASDDLEMEDNDVSDADDSEMEDDDDEQNKGNLSTYEKEREKIQAKIKQMEAENLAPKDWTMQGEISASKRPVDSALEVDLDFEHNIRPPPVITEEVTASLEEIIKKRILEGHFDDVQRAPKVPSAAPKETKELDDNKSKKGLAEIYEEEYAQQTGFVAAPLSFNDELKEEASNLFKRLCLKLDALSHFHFAPKPVIEDMSIQTNVPALAMEEIAPVAVSDAAMLAPEEVFSGKKDIKEANELTKEDRKKRRAKKKRKFKAVNAKKVADRAPEKPSQALTEGKEQ
ncbi:U3 small nucleolar ribonucleoprotein protein MPP10-like [Chenopodium quinoa]|uniref:U3 small nucleolar ribonucleoprotein protein MPP10-like n=1 Tax=Chenopodium quinoa TaxID=63459 RepID=UPI000B77B2F7|nr:U3 small nucleolar ribonucleoprotein protein MPP10-like [Chenopodium quinoa]